MNFSWNPYAGTDSVAAFASDTSMLVPGVVPEVDEFGNEVVSNLVSIYAEPERAAELWRARAAQNPYGDEGFVSIKNYGRELFDPTLSDQVSAVWLMLVELAEEYLQRGIAQRSFPGQSVTIELRRERSTAVVAVEGRTTLVNATTLVPGIIFEAERFALWVEERIGTRDAELFEAIALARTTLSTRSVYLD